MPPLQLQYMKLGTTKPCPRIITLRGEEAGVFDETPKCEFALAAGFFLCDNPFIKSRSCALRSAGIFATSLLAPPALSECSHQADPRRHRHQPRMPPLAKIRPGSPAPSSGRESFYKPVDLCSGSPPIPAETGRKYSNYSLVRFVADIGRSYGVGHQQSFGSQKRAEAPQGMRAASALTTGGSGGYACGWRLE